MSYLLIVHQITCNTSGLKLEFMMCQVTGKRKNVQTVFTFLALFPRPNLRVNGSLVDFVEKFKGFIRPEIEFLKNSLS